MAGGAPAAPVMPNARTGPEYVTPLNLVGDYRHVAEGGDQNYAAPENEGNLYYMQSPAGNWGPTLQVGVDGVTPDAARIGKHEGADYRPRPFAKPPVEWWLGAGPGQESKDRTIQAEYIDGDGWEMTRRVAYQTDKRAIPDIRRTPPPEPRLTNQMAPITRTYTRPFDQVVAHGFNGEHFSMADHRRNYGIYGMQPTHTRRNTYRLDPAPWDENVVDVGPPAQGPELFGGRLAQAAVPVTSARASGSWRLT